MKCWPSCSPLQPADENLTPQALRSLEILHSVARDLGDCPLGDQLCDGLWGVEAVLEVWGAERARMAERQALWERVGYEPPKEER